MNAKTIRPIAKFSDPKDHQTYQYYGKCQDEDRYLFRETFQKSEDRRVFYSLTRKEFENDVLMHKYQVDEIIEYAEDQETKNEGKAINSIIKFANLLIY